MATLGELVVYPNPATRILNLRVPGAAARYRVISTLGLTVLEGSLKRHGQLNIAGLPTGHYQLQVTTAAGRSVRKFIKQ